MNYSTKRTISMAILLALTSGSAVAGKGVAYDAAGSVWRNSAGECWTTDFRDADPGTTGCFAEPMASDTDGDGVVDEQDRCPDTPAGVSVDSQGCIPDSDGDGVVDAKDQCPGTPAGASVDGRGCAMKIVLNRIPFEVDSDRIEAGYAAELRQVADTLKSRQDVKSVQVIGHTDSLGSTRYNQALSEKRARAVAQFLVSEGVPAAIIQVSGEGETAPVADNATAQGREQNRRVELKVN
ncbi:MAG: OmpA family protein [Candidatus Thiodiazotropha sp.]